MSSGTLVPQETICAYNFRGGVVSYAHDQIVPAETNHSMKARIFFWSITSALAGFLFGFDTVVISGAEQTIQSLWHLSPTMHGLAMGSALYGTVLGSLLGVAAFPSVIYTAMCLAIPESPRWQLGRKRDRAAGIKLLQLIRVKLMVPETKGKTLEEIQQKLGLQ